MRNGPAWLAAAAGFALTLAAFWPGYLSYDSAVQWSEARHGVYTNIHPPLMAMLWSLSERLFPGPGPMLASSALLYWGAIAMLVQAVCAPAWARVLLVLVAGFWPPAFALLAHVWKDVALMALLGLAVGALACSLRDSQRPWRWRTVALLACVLACAMRHNAATALPPLLLWIAWEAGLGASRPRRSRWLLAGLAACVALPMLATLPERMPGVTRYRVWPAVAAWDVAAVSVSERRLLLPPGLLFPGDPLPRLAQHYTPATNVPTLVSGGVRSNFLFPYSDDQYRELRAQWLGLPLRYPRAYFAHRLAVAGRLFGWIRDPQVDQMALAPGVVALGDNPALAPRGDRFNAAVQRALNRAVGTPLFAGWLYLMLALAVVAAGLRRRDPRARLASATAASGLCYALPLLVAAGSAEFRYLSWLVSATILSLLLLLPVRASTSASDPRHAEPTSSRSRNPP
jgi:hypothetical protein